MHNQEIINQVAKEFNIPPREVYKIWTAYWRFIKDSIQQLPLKENITEEDFNKLQTSINLSSIGHLTCSYRRMVNIKKKKQNGNS